MPSILGIIGKLSKGNFDKKIKTMIQTIIHDPSYSFGTFVDDDLLHSIGWSCHKGSFSDCMPIVNEKNDILMFIAGEVFLDNAVLYDLKAELHATFLNLY